MRACDTSRVCMLNTSRFLSLHKLHKCKCANKTHVHTYSNIKYALNLFTQGIDQSQEHETGTRDSIELPGVQVCTTLLSLRTHMLVSIFVQCVLFCSYFVMRFTTICDAHDTSTSLSLSLSLSLCSMPRTSSSHHFIRHLVVCWCWS